MATLTAPTIPRTWNEKEVQLYLKHVLLREINRLQQEGEDIEQNLPEDGNDDLDKRSNELIFDLALIHIMRNKRFLRS